MYCVLVDLGTHKPVIHAKQQAEKATRNQALRDSDKMVVDEKKYGQGCYILQNIETQCMTHYDLHVKLIAERTTFGFGVFDVSKTRRILLFNCKKKTKKNSYYTVSSTSAVISQSTQSINHIYLSE